MSCTFIFNLCCELCFLLCIFLPLLTFLSVDLQIALFLQLWAYAYFPTLAPIPKDEVAPAVPRSRLYDGKCYPRCCTVTTFACFRHFFDIVTTYEITWQPWVIMPAGTRDDYTDSWETSRSRILLEGSFHRTW